MSTRVHCTILQMPTILNLSRSLDEETISWVEIQGNCTGCFRSSAGPLTVTFYCGTSARPCWRHTVTSSIGQTVNWSFPTRVDSWTWYSAISLWRVWQVRWATLSYTVVILVLWALFCSTIVLWNIHFHIGFQNRVYVDTTVKFEYFCGPRNLFDIDEIQYIRGDCYSFVLLGPKNL